MARRPAVFFDRDGVLNEVVERDGAHLSPQTIDALRLAPDLESIERLRRADYLTFMITNQPDVSRGWITMELVESIFDRIADRVSFDDHRACFHDNADACDCRKPKPGMIVDLASQWNVDLSRSYVVGDTWRDVDAARAAGVRAILLRREYNAAVVPDAAVATLTEAVDLILGDRDEMVTLQ